MYLLVLGSYLFRDFGEITNIFYLFVYVEACGINASLDRHGALDNAIVPL